MSARPPPRLFVIMAARAHVAVIVRRGPSAWAQLILWDTARDTFTEGSWFRGRIFEQKCDVAPDGRLFVYAAHQGARNGSSYTSSWTAVSRPPWLHALALWPVGTTYGGGGRFTSDRSLTLRRGITVPGGRDAHPDHPATGLTVTSGLVDLHASSGEVPDAAWSGRDQNNRLVYAKDGRIFARLGLLETELADFRFKDPAPQAPPREATRPL